MNAVSAPAPAGPTALPTPRPLRPGECAPRFVCASDTNPAFEFSTLGGCWTLLMFWGSLGAPVSMQAYQRVLARRAIFDDVNGHFFGVSIDPADRDTRGVRNSMPGLRYFWDFNAAVSRGYGFAGEGVFMPTALLLDRAQRIVAVAPLGQIDDLLDLAERHIAEDAAREAPFAPVLTIPRVFEPELCAELIRLYQAEGGVASGHMTTRDGLTVGELDTGRKRRSDVYVQDEAFKAELRTRLEKRLAPMIFRAFGWNATRIERYLIGCYSSADRGFFFPHRDNTTAGTAHRKFAVTINLNAEDHEGGELRFPEFGPRAYKAPTGGAVVFGCSLLHEALPVTAGVRYAFLPFLYDEEGAATRAANLHKIASK